MDNSPTHSTDLPLPSWHRRLPIITGFGVLAVVLLFIGYIFTWSFSKTPQENRTATGAGLYPENYEIKKITFSDGVSFEIPEFFTETSLESGEKIFSSYFGTSIKYFPEPSSFPTINCTETNLKELYNDVINIYLLKGNAAQNCDFEGYTGLLAEIRNEKGSDEELNENISSFILISYNKPKVSDQEVEKLMSQILSSLTRDSSIETNILLPQTSNITTTLHQVGNYSFKLPDNLKMVRKEKLFTEFASNLFQVKVILNGSGYGAQCVEEKSSTMVDSPIGQVELRKFLGINSELPDCANQDHREAWVHLNYPETTKNDVLVLTWKNSEIDDAKADQLLNVIIRSLSLNNSN